MGRMWVCEGRVAKRPLIVSARIYLYSFEELCEYLYRNAESVEESFYNEAFCQWLADETGMEHLSEVLREGIEKGKSGGWCMERILEAGGYYSRKDAAKAVSIVKSMESTSPAQRAKLKGDRFLRAGKYRKAWLEYKKALDEESDLFFKGRVWHNLGTLYARQFLFEAAGECYKRAYEIGQQTVSSEAYLFALTCRDGLAKGTEAKGMGAGGEEYDRGMGKKLSKLHELKVFGDRAGYEGMVEDLLFKLRLEYRKSE